MALRAPAADAIRADIARLGVGGDVDAAALSRALLTTLLATAALLQPAHPLDGARPGSTMSFAIDALRAWCEKARALWATPPLRAAPSADRDAFLLAPAWADAGERVYAALSLPHTTTANRARTMLLQLCAVWDAAAEPVVPRRTAADAPWVQPLSRAATAAPDAQAAVLWWDALIARYGVRALGARDGATAASFFPALLAGIQAGHGSVSRRSKLAIAYIRAVMRDEQNRSAETHWLPALARSLAHGDERASDNVLAHIVQPLLDQEPRVLPALLGGVAREGGASQEGEPQRDESQEGQDDRAWDEESLTRVYMAVLRVAKARGLVVVEAPGDGGEEDNAVRPPTGAPPSAPLGIPSAALRACMDASSARIQVAALALVVDAKSPAIPLTPAERTLIRTFFERSLTMPSAVARKDSIAYFVKLLVRVRMGLGARQPQQQHAAMHAFLRALYHSIVQAMHPGAPYACTVLAVSLLRLLVEASVGADVTLVDGRCVGIDGEGAGVDTTPASAAPTADALQDAVHALRKAHKSYAGGAPLPRPPLDAALLLRLLHLASASTYADIQEAASVLLIRVGELDAGAPAHASLLGRPAFIAEHVVRPSVARLGAMQDAEAHASLQLLALYERVCGVRAWPWRSVLPALHTAAAPLARSDRVPAAPASWHDALFDVHLAVLETQLDAAETPDVAAASQHGAVHGTFAALRHLVVSAPRGAALPYVPRIATGISRIWRVTQPVLCAAAPEANEDEAIGGDDGGVAALLAPGAAPREPAPPRQEAAPTLSPPAPTPPPQRILSYSWRAVRDASALLAAATAATLQCRAATHASLHAANAQFVEWMLQIRHRGAFSTIYPHFLDMAYAVVRAPDASVSALPAAWLADILLRLDTQGASISTTRRSAGVGYAVLALLCAHAGKAAAPLVDATVARLLRMARSDEPVRAIHASNVLRVLVMDSTLAGAMRAHLGGALACAITSFRSTRWSVRNASMMLFAAISTRYFGVRAFARAGPDARSAPTQRSLNELLAEDASLGATILGILTAESAHVSADDLAAVGHGSSLYAVLLLLSTMRADASAQLPRRACLAAVERCVRSANWKVRVRRRAHSPQIRELAALAYTVLLLPHEAIATLQRLLDAPPCADQNALHGMLLLVRSLRAECARVSADHDALVAAQLLRHVDALLVHNPCPATCAAFLDLIGDLASRAPLPAEHLAALSDWLQAFFGALAHRPPLGTEPRALRQLATDPFSAVLLPSALAVASALSAAHGRALLPTDAAALFRARGDVCSVVLRQLCAWQQAGTYADALHALRWPLHGVHEELLDLALDDAAPADGRILAAQLLAAAPPPAPAARARSPWFADGRPTQHASTLLALVLTTRSPPLRDALLPLLGAAAAACAEDDVFQRHCVSAWDICSQETQPASARRGVACAMSHVRASVLGHTSARASAPLHRARVVLLRLLHDDDADVRDAACLLVSRGMRTHATPAPAPLDALSALLQRLRLGVNACTEHLWDVLGRENPAEWSAAVWELLTRGLQGRCMHVHSSPPEGDVAPGPTAALFPAESDNQFYDRAVDIIRAHRWLSERRVRMPARGDVVRLAASQRARLSAVPQRAAAADAAGFAAALQCALVVDLAVRLGYLPRDPDTAELLAAARQALLLAPTDRAVADADDAPAACASRRLHIALISDFFFPNVGGVEGHMYMIGQYLLRRGHKVIVITHAYANRAGVRYLGGGMKVYYVPCHVIARQDTLPNFFALLPILRSIFVREDIDIVHGHQALSSMAHEGIFHAKSLGIKAVFTDHSLFGFADVASILTNKLLKFALTDIDHVVCVSHTGRENTVLRAALRPEDVSTIPNAIDAHHFTPDPAAAPRGHVCIVVLSRLMYRKGVDLLTSTIPRLCAEHTDITFVIGGDGPKLVELEQMRERFMLQDRVELVGAVRQRDVRAHLTRGHIFLNTSLTEAFGTSIIEATCAGLYVVSTRVGGIPELLPSSMIRLAEPSDDALVRETNAAIARIRAGQHDFVRQHRIVAGMYSWMETVRRLEAVYETAMNAPPRTSAERFARHMMLVLLLDWLHPRDRIPRAPPIDRIGERCGAEDFGSVHAAGVRKNEAAHSTPTE
ncbi:phosphatidylinositol N-acetylglucosaminyltransferase [Malassezia sp. CBS 17886]|nr:phosphatidylinositol N-acetylglucosaminyltransferase [Malassezia sp. CBS 17886]